jgi:hypothetical protein
MAARQITGKKPQTKKGGWLGAAALLGGTSMKMSLHTSSGAGDDMLVNTSRKLSGFHYNQVRHSVAALSRKLRHLSLTWHMPAPACTLPRVQPLDATPYPLIAGRSVVHDSHVRRRWPGCVLETGSISCECKQARQACQYTACHPACYLVVVTFQAARPNPPKMMATVPAN